jgi:hypothetical protein
MSIDTALRVPPNRHRLRDAQALVAEAAIQQAITYLSGASQGMTSKINCKVTLARRSKGVSVARHFQSVEDSVTKSVDGQVLVRVHYLSVDSAMLTSVLR